jgi:hypothetical protein
MDTEKSAIPLSQAIIIGKDGLADLNGAAVFIFMLVRVTIFGGMKVRMRMPMMFIMFVVMTMVMIMAMLMLVVTMNMLVFVTVFVMMSFEAHRLFPW